MQYLTQVISQFFVGSPEAYTTLGLRFNSGTWLVVDGSGDGDDGARLIVIKGVVGLRVEPLSWTEGWIVECIIGADAVGGAVTGGSEV